MAIMEGEQDEKILKDAYFSPSSESYSAGCMLVL